MRQRWAAFSPRVCFNLFFHSWKQPLLWRVSVSLLSGCRQVGSFAECPRHGGVKGSSWSATKPFGGFGGQIQCLLFATVPNTQAWAQPVNSAQGTHDFRGAWPVHMGMGSQTSPLELEVISPKAEFDANLYMFAGILAFLKMLLLQKWSQNAQFFFSSHQFNLILNHYSEALRLKVYLL